jgi:hypothetical protein
MTRLDLVLEFVEGIARGHEEVSIQPGELTRDVFLEGDSLDRVNRAV